MTNMGGITADAVTLQERDGFRAAGWLKLVAPAKVNLHLAIGARRADGYHEAVSVMHAINLHDVVYARRLPDADGNGAMEPHARAGSASPDRNAHGTGTGGTVPGAGAGASGTAPGTTTAPGDASGAAPGVASGAGTGTAPGATSAPNASPGDVVVRMVACGGVELPAIAPEGNLAARAVRALGVGGIELRIEKNIPVEGGLGGGSSDAAAALVAAAALAGIAPDDPAIERAARKLGADVAFFLHGGCAVLGGAGDEFVRALEPSKRAVAVVKPAGGVSTAAAYRAFDEAPSPVPAGIAANAAGARRADDVALFNNLAPASERLAPELAEVRAWLSAQPGVEGALLCGSGSATFATCSDFAATCTVVAGARRRGWWARATSFGSARAMLVAGGNALADGGCGAERGIGRQTPNSPSPGGDDVLVGKGNALARSGHGDGSARQEPVGPSARVARAGRSGNAARGEGSPAGTAR